MSEDRPPVDETADRPEQSDPAGSEERHGSVMARWGSRGTAVVLSLSAVVLLLIGATIGLALSKPSQPSASVVPGTDSVDAGFSRDMIVHHSQGVLMAHYAELDTDDPEIGLLAYDINYTQTAQIGQMQGWLALWDLPQVVAEPHMAWMTTTEGGHAMDMGGSTSAGVTGLMPGMATDEEINTLKSLRGKASDIYFLQLMIRHHQGGAPMMEDAQIHAENPVVRNFAAKMLVAQTGEVTQMTQMLAARGAQPLPFDPTAPAGSATTGTGTASAPTSEAGTTPAPVSSSG